MVRVHKRCQDSRPRRRRGAEGSAGRKVLCGAAAAGGGIGGRWLTGEGAAECCWLGRHD